jgi:Flp pilus assembly protein TadG
MRRLLQLKLGRRGSFALEFAIVAPIFMVMLFTVFEVSYDEFMQEILDSAMQSTAREVQVGKAQGASSYTFVKSYFCPYGSGLLNCNNLFVRIQEISFSAGACSNLTSTKATGDFYDATPTSWPASNGILQLGDFYGGDGAMGNGSDDNLSPCATTSSSSGYCNAGPQEFILMTGIYVAPSFLDGLVLNHITYGGQYVRVLYSTAAFETEPFYSTSPSDPC